MKIVKVEPNYVLALHRGYDGEVLASLGYLNSKSPGLARGHTSFEDWPIEDALRDARRVVEDDGTLYVIDPEGLWDPKWGNLQDAIETPPSIGEGHE